MTRSPLWRELESGDNLLLRLLRFFILTGGIAVLLSTGVLDLTWPQQTVVGLLSVLIAIWIDRSSTSYLVTLTLMLVSLYSTFRYGFWRMSSIYRYFFEPGAKGTAVDAFFIGLLMFAELYAFAILTLGYLQTLWPLRRTPVPLPDDPEEWPAIDLLIPTCNEPLSVVRFTVLASMNIDWPVDKLNISILDDGNREEFRLFAEEAGVAYITRIDNLHAKAGNINRALERLNAPYVVLFDSDHVPTRSFLQVTMGWFLRDANLGMLQTPHHFYSPDPFERNLGQFRVIPNEGELFYGVVQDGNDFWNATFFCGSCAVLRRSALDAVGGIAVETLTEDAHTSLRMQMNGWNTAYINIPQAAGLATERLSGHIQQRIRWARGMVQILRLENPLFARGLSLAQRLCYFNAMSHFLYALPRLIFLTAPLVYLILGQTSIPGYWAAILAYGFPHLILASVTNSRIQGQHRHSFWNEIYETVLSPYIFVPTLLALINPKLGKFNVTAKGGVVNRSFFDTRIAQPFLFLLALNILGILMSIPRFFHVHLPYLQDRLYDGSHPGAIVMNLLWCLFNTVIVGVAAAAAWESQQRRQSVRVTMSVPADVILANGAMIAAVTVDVSSGGVMMSLEEDRNLVPGDSLRLVLPVLDGDAVLPARVVSFERGTLRAQFDSLTLREQEALTMVLYSRADTWLGWGEAREIDHPLRSIYNILRLSLRGLGKTMRHLFQSGDARPKQRYVPSIVPAMLLAFLLGSGAKTVDAAQVEPSAPSPAALSVPKTPQPGQFESAFTLADIGATGPIVLRGTDATQFTRFSIPRTQVVKSASLKLRYHFSPALLPALSHLNISLNGNLVATLPVTASQIHSEGNAPSSSEPSAVLESTLTLPADSIVQTNELRFEFIGHYSNQCEDPFHSALWAHIDASSTIALNGSLLPLQNDLKLLPLPFYDPAVNLHPIIPVVFHAQPSPQALRAAAIVTSWFGMLAGDRAARFPVSIGAIPSGDAIVIGEDSGPLSASLNITSAAGPTVAMRTNPTNPYAKVLVVTGDTPDDLVIAAQSLALQRDLLQGDQVSLHALHASSPRQPDDAPRWLPTSRITRLGEIAQTEDLQGDGSAPIALYLRLPPDLYFGNTRNLAFHLGYRYNGIPLASGSSLQVSMNAAYASSTPLPHTAAASAILSTIVPIPVIDMRPFSNSLLLHFVFHPANSSKTGDCQNDAPPTLQGAVLKDSYLDLRGIPHVAFLPNLEIFANAGYPFTRLADLRETAVVLPDTPSPEEIELFLTFMGHFGAQTGYPALNVEVTDAEGMRSDQRRDYIVLGTADDQPVLKKLAAFLPVVIDGGGLHIQDTQGFFAPLLQHAWWRVRASNHDASGQLETSGGLPDALIEGLEWPSGSKRSVVVIALRDKSIAANFLEAFLRRAQSSDIAQSVSVLHGSVFTSYRIGGEVFRLGSLSPWTMATLFFAEYPWIVVLCVMLTCVFLSILIRAILRRRARSRLQGN